MSSYLHYNTSALHMNALIQMTAQQSCQSNSKMYVLALSSCSFASARWLA
jgi:hypothetical protein